MDPNSLLIGKNTLYYFDLTGYIASVSYRYSDLQAAEIEGTLLTQYV